MTRRLTTILALGAAFVATGAAAQDSTVQVGLLGGITGPIESLMPPIQAGAQLAVDQVNAAGGLGSGQTIEVVVGDTGCVDTARASAAADGMVNSDNVPGIIGAMCSGATIAAANSAAIPAGVVMVSPASTSPAVTSLEDNDLVFRTAPSDAYQGEVLAGITLGHGIDTVAVTYVNNDYGAAFSEAFVAAFEEAGGTVVTSEAHEDGQADYRALIGSLASTGAPALVVLAYVDGSGGRIIQQARETGDFNTFVGGDGMVGASLTDVVDGGGELILTRPGGAETPGFEPYSQAAQEAGFEPGATYAATSYDAAMALLLALEKNGVSREGLNEALREVATAPGEVILPGEWEKAKQLISEGTDINYEGASGSLEFDENGDVPADYQEVTVKGGEIIVVEGEGADTDVGTDDAGAAEGSDGASATGGSDAAAEGTDGAEEEAEGTE